jgi:elongation of very long chain fatty acids protein 7
VFIVLKKNNRQLSFLHRYHHFGICLGTYCIAKWTAGGTASVLGIINSFVHSVMYSYYFFTAFKPELKKSIWWKKYITQIQLVQFAFLAVYYLRHLLSPSCGYSRVFSWAIFVQSFFMLAMFGDFYVKVYGKKATK